MTNPTIAVATLTKPVLARYMDDLIALEQLIVAELGILYDEHPWGVPEFELDLPGKWDYSWCATDTDTEAAVGFLVISRFGDNLHGHRMVVHPGYRRLGIGHQLYIRRKDLVRRFAKAGIVAGGVIPGYKDHIHEMSADDYVDKVVAGELYDPTLSFQLDNGFEALGAIPDYMDDPAVGDNAVLIVWRNPDLADPA